VQFQELMLDLHLNKKKKLGLSNEVDDCSVCLVMLLLSPLKCSSMCRVNDSTSEKSNEEQTGQDISFCSISDDFCRYKYLKSSKNIIG